MQKLLINNPKSNNSEVKSNNAVEEMAKEIHSLKTYDTYWADECRELASDLYARGWRKQSEWISVDERLPEESGRFLLVDDEGYMFIASWYTTSGWFMPFCHITHWMPLPEPPKMKGERV